jgi:hypothetical protein
MIGWIRRNEDPLWAMGAAVVVMIPSFLKVITLSDAIAGFAALVIARFTVKLATVSAETQAVQKELAELSQEANILEVWAQKNVMDPDLRAFVEGKWQQSPPMRVEGKDDQGKVVSVKYRSRWVAELVLWNTGTGSILLTGWEVDDETGKWNFHVKESRTGTRDLIPPILIAAQQQLSLHVDITCESAASIEFTYSTAQEDDRTIDVPVGE